MAEKVLVPPHMFACLDAEGETYIVEVDLPGVNKEHIDLRMHEDIIHVLAKGRPSVPWTSTFPYKGQSQESQGQIQQRPT